jgi:hypothetical protein
VGVLRLSKLGERRRMAKVILSFGVLCEEN